MEDQEGLDYSSDRLEGVDIWEVPGGKVYEDLVDISMLGPEMLHTAGLESVPSSSGFSPLDYIISPEQLPHDLQTALDGEQSVDLLGDAS